MSRPKGLIKKKPFIVKEGKKEGKKALTACVKTDRPPPWNDGSEAAARGGE